MNVKRGDVVLVDYPYTKGGGTKVRPALVIQNDKDNQRIVNTIIAQITGTIHRASTEPTQLLVDVTTSEGRQSGLKQTSAVNCLNLFTIHQQDVLGKLGSLSPLLMKRIDDCVKVALELP